MHSFKEFLLEIFDKPWKSEYNKEASEKLRELKKDSGETGHKIHQLEGNNGHVLTYKKNGFTEIHHIANSGMSGIISNMHSDKEPEESGANPRFYSTMIHHAKEHLEKGHGVMIKGPQHLLKHYRKVADKFKKDYKVEHHDDHTIIRPHKEEIEEMMKIALKK